MVEGLTDAQIIERLQRLETQVRALSEQAGIPYDDGSAGIPDEVVRLARGGERMQAAKRLTELTGTDFVSAQKLVGEL